MGINDRHAGLLAAMWCVAGAACAGDARLEELHATLLKLRATPAETTMEHPPVLLVTAAKHQLRGWIEGQLDSLKDLGDQAAFAAHVNDALKSVGTPLGEVRISNESGILMVMTAVGIACQYDMSAYAYASVNGHWKRVWESKQDSPKHYTPQRLAAHLYRPPTDRHEEGPHYVMTPGYSSGCAGAWPRCTPGRPGSRRVADAVSGAEMAVNAPAL